ncbi:hypothetical protein HYQ45_015389 [Verticillium longisporum]|uniref:Uncharacterized protein n=1 Tax=Verticillium longisporum TaxID=100787 RepID=A0A8I2Z8W4_VERLO|nr:hypothetical protein HYQ45_015389 [Verticillium longisporum]
MGDIREPTPELDRGVTNPTTSTVNEAATNQPVNLRGTATTSSTTSSSTAQPTGKNKAIQWEINRDLARSFPVFVAGESGKVPHAINALLLSDLVLEKGEWSYKREGAPEVTLATTSTQSNQVPNSGDTGETRVRQTDGRGSLEMSENSLVLPLGVLESSQALYGLDMYLNLTWRYKDEIGWSNSGVFTVVETVEESAKRMARQIQAFETEEHLSDEVSRIINGGSNVIPLGPSNTDLTLAPSTTGIASSADDEADLDDDNDEGGLSIGAKAGIGAGAGVVGLALIVALLWFFCLRNRHKKKGHVSKNPYNTEGHVSEYMVNKETTGARVTESPHSPYSDDGSLAQQQQQQQQQQQLQNQTASSSPRETTAFVTSVAAAPSSSRHNLERQSEGQDRGLSEATPLAASTPHSDSQQPQHESTRPGARSATPQGVNSNVSHLIEDGMTEDEIRRLEDEERQLDAAIEQHGHGRRLA